MNHTDVNPHPGVDGEDDDDDDDIDVEEEDVEEEDVEKEDVEEEDVDEEDEEEEDVDDDGKEALCIQKGVKLQVVNYNLIHKFYTFNNLCSVQSKDKYGSKELV